LLFPPFEAPKLRISLLVAYFQCPFSLTYGGASYGCCCACSSCSIRVEKEEVGATQEQKKLASKRNRRN